MKLSEEIKEAIRLCNNVIENADYMEYKYMKEYKKSSIDILVKEIERLNNIINEINSIVEYWGYDKEHNDISSFRMAMKNIKDILGSDKE